MSNPRLRFALAILLLVSMPFSSLAGELSVPMPVVNIFQATNGNNNVMYPQLAEGVNAETGQAVNRQIQEALRFHLDLFAAITEPEARLVSMTAEYNYFPADAGQGLLSVLMSVTGRMPTGRVGHRLIPLVFDLTTGNTLHAKDLFVDPKTAQAQLDTMTEEALADELSNYLDISALSPFPLERFHLTPTGITFAYPDNSLVWLSGKTASIHYYYHELADLLLDNNDSILAGLDNLPFEKDNALVSETIGQAVQSGVYPGTIAAVSGKLQPLIERYALLFDPEGFPEGQKYQLEDDVFRGTVLISKDQETVFSILSTRVNLAGLIPGRTQRSAVLSALGDPNSSLQLDQAAGAAYGLYEGRLDSYQFGNELRLFYNNDNLLSAIWLVQAQ